MQLQQYRSTRRAQRRAILEEGNVGDELLVAMRYGRAGNEGRLGL